MKYTSNNLACFTLLQSIQVRKHLNSTTCINDRWSLLLFFKFASEVCQRYHWYQQEAFTPPAPIKGGTP